MNSGQSSLATLHANSAREAVTKLCTLPLLAGNNISSDFVVPTVAGSVDIVVHLRPAADGSRRVREIAALTGRMEGHHIELAPLFSWRNGRLVRDVGFPRHEDRFEQHGFRLSMLLRAPK